MVATGRISRLLSCLAGSILVFLLALHFATPRLINSNALKGRIQAYLHDRTGASVSYAKAEIRLLPVPEIILHQVSMSIPHKAEGSVAVVRVYPRLSSLLRGTAWINEVMIEAPHLEVRISDDAGKASLEELEGKIRSVVHYLTSDTPGLRVLIQDGSLHLAGKDETVYTFGRIRSQVTASDQAVHVELTGGSNLWDSMSVSASVEAEGLKSAGEIRLEHLHPDPLLPRQRKKTAVPIRLLISDAGLSAKFSAAGLRAVRASMEGSLSGLDFSRRRGRLLMGDTVIRADAAIDPDAVALRITEARIGRPALNLSARYAWDRRNGGMTADLESAPFRVKPVRDAAMAAADDIPLVRTICTCLEGGEVQALRLHASGKSLREMGRTENVRVAGSLSRGIVYVEARDLRLQEVTGSVIVSDGVLEAKDVSAFLEGQRCSRGSLRVGLSGEDAVFNLDTQIQADAGRLPALLREKKLLSDGAVLREMDRLRDISGSLEGRLTIGGRLDSVSVRIGIDAMNVTGRYDPLPFPLTVTKGKLYLDGDRLEVADAAGSMGRSSFAGLSGRLSLAEPPYLEIMDGQLAVSADEIYPWLTSFGETRPLLKDVRSVSGMLSVSSMKLRGPLHEPGAWSFRLDGGIRDLALDASFLPGPAEGANGVFTATQEEFRLSRMQSKIMDSQVTVSGSVRGYRAPDLDLTLQGDIGPAVGAWIVEVTKLPPELKIQTPFSVTEGRFAIEREKKVQFGGRLLFGQGTQVSITAMRTPDSILIPSLTVEDRGSHAAASMSITEDSIDAAFSGALTSQALDAVFESSVFTDASLEGALRVHIVHDQPRRSSAEGRLKGRNIPIPGGRAVPLVLRHFEFEAKGQDMVIDAAELAAGDLILRARGKVASLPEWFGVDLDISANGIQWETLEKMLRHQDRAASAGGKGILEDFPVRGTLRLGSDFFRFRGLSWEPFEADLSYDGATLLISPRKAALCGVSTTGDLRIGDGGAKLDMVLSAKDLPLRPTVLCVTDKQADATGTYRLEAGLKAEGPLSGIVDRIEGRFTLFARDGKILKSKQLDRTLDLLNEAENFRGQFPDLDENVITYSSLSVRGAVQGQRIRIEEAVLESPVGILAQGYVDFGNDELDLTAFVAPLRATRKIPVIGYFMGGNLVSIPVRIRGSIREPQISFLSLSAIGARTLGILESIFRLPITLVEPVFPAQRN